MTCQITTYLSHKIGPDLIICIKHLKLTCDALCFPINEPRPVPSFSLGFQLKKILPFIFVCPVLFYFPFKQKPSHLRFEVNWC